MQELMQKRKEQLAQATITQLRRRGFEAEWFDTAAQAREAALQLLPECCTVAWGGSATISARILPLWAMMSWLWIRRRRFWRTCFPS